MERKALIDLGFIGPGFTWNHGVSIETRRSFRLDRGLCESNGEIYISESQY